MAVIRAALSIEGVTNPLPPPVSIGGAVTFRLTFTDASGAAVSATGVLLDISRPDGVELSVPSGSMVGSGTGVWLYDLTLDQAGQYRVRGLCTGPSGAVTDELPLTVVGSSTSPPLPTGPVLVDENSLPLALPNGALLTLTRADRAPEATEMAGMKLIGVQSDQARHVAWGTLEAAAAAAGVVGASGAGAAAGAEAGAIAGAEVAGAAGAEAGTTAGAAAGAAAGAEAGAEAGTAAGAIAGTTAGAAAAEPFATAASASATTATTASTAAGVAKTAAEAARDAALAAARVYATTAAGITATTTGQYFYIPSASADESLILYLNSAGVAVEQKRYPSSGAVASLQLANEFGSARQRYLDGLRTANETKPKAAVVILLGQSLNAPRGTIVKAKTVPGAKMPFAGTATASWPFTTTNALWAGHWDDLAACIDYEERTGQTPGSGLASTLLGGKFQRAYIGNCAIGARTLAVLNKGGPSSNLWALLKRLCQQARDDGYAPQVMFYTAHGEANAAAATTEDAYYQQGMEYYGGVCQLWAAQAMRKPGYVAPVVLSYPASQNYGGNGDYDRAIKAAIKRIAADLPNGLNLGAIYQWPVETDRIHPTTPSYVKRGEAVGRRLRAFFEGGATDPALHITGVTLSGTTFVATFSGPVARDATLGVGETLNAALAEDGLEWLDNGVGIAISGLLYQGWTVHGTLASAPTGTLEQQTLRIAVQTTTSTLTAGPGNLSGSLVRSAGTGWPSLSDYTYTNFVYASPQTFKQVTAP